MKENGKNEARGTNVRNEERRQTNRLSGAEVAIAKCCHFALSPWRTHQTGLTFFFFILLQNIYFRDSGKISMRIR